MFFKRSLLAAVLFASFAALALSCGEDDGSGSPEKFTEAKDEYLEEMMGWKGDCLIWKLKGDTAFSPYLLEMRRGTITEAFGDEQVYRLILTVNSDPENGLRNEVLRDMVFSIGKGAVTLRGANYRGAFGDSGFLKYEPGAVFLKPEPGKEGEPIIASNDTWTSETERAGKKETHVVTVFNNSEINTPLGVSYDAFEITHQHAGANTDTYWLVEYDYEKREGYGFIQMTLNLKQGGAEKKEITLKLDGRAAQECPAPFKSNAPPVPSAIN